MLTKREAVKAGREAGKSAASWKFDGNTSDKTYRAYLEARDEGGMILNAFEPPSWLSGEWAGESMNELLGECENARDEERQDDVASAYEDAAERAYWAELDRTARYHVR